MRISVKQLFIVTLISKALTRLNEITILEMILTAANIKLPGNIIAVQIPSSRFLPGFA